MDGAIPNRYAESAMGVPSDCQRLLNDSLICDKQNHELAEGSMIVPEERRSIQLTASGPPNAVPGR